MVLLLNLNCIATVIADDDSSAFVAKTEFEALKKDFKGQIDQYNSSIESKIDGAIASYFADLKLKRKNEIKNYYESYDCGTKWKWGNNTGTRTVPPYGGNSTNWYGASKEGNHAGTFTYSNVDDWTNYLFLGDSSKNQIYLTTPKKYNIAIYDFDILYWSYNWSMIYGSRTWYTVHWSDLKPERNGKVKSINTNTSGTEMNQWTVYLVETYEEPPSDWTATLSVNRTATEYYIQQEGDSDGTPVFVASYDASKSSPNWSESSGKPLERNQTILSQWYPSWTKSCAHNQLRIKEWEDVTSKEERVASGAPVAFIDNDEASAEISFSVNVAGTIYVYASANPIAYSSLVESDTVSIQNVTELNTTKIVTLENCPKNSWIRVVYLPSTGVATLNIEKVIAEV